MLSRLFFAALSSLVGKGLTSLILFVVLKCVFVGFPCGILGQVWYLIASIPPDLCPFSYLVKVVRRDQLNLSMCWSNTWSDNYGQTSLYLCVIH